MKISKLICNIFQFIYCVFDIDMHIFLCIEVAVFEIKLQKKHHIHNLLQVNIMSHILKGDLMEYNLNACRTRQGVNVD